MAELEENYRRHLAEMDCVCCIEGSHIIFKPSDVGKFEIALSRCDTYEKVVWWTFHLTEKKWMTIPVLRHFIRLVCSHHGFQ